VANNKWLIAYDFSPEANQIAEIVASELEKLNGEMLLLHVYHVPPPPGAFTALATEMTYASSQELGEALYGNAQKHLEAIAADIQRRFPHVITEVVVREGDAVDEVLEVAREKKIERIVVGTHARAGVERLLLGSVAEKIVRLSPVSVLVLKTAQF
jgi:nucleotide-binding universal stress UspA family protein